MSWAPLGLVLWPTHLVIMTHGQGVNSCTVCLPLLSSVLLKLLKEPTVFVSPRVCSLVFCIVGVQEIPVGQ